MLRSLPFFFLLLVVHLPQLHAEETPINPIARTVKEHLLATWDFSNGPATWTAENQCKLSASDGVLRITSTGDDPFFHTPVDFPGGQIVVELRIRNRGNTGGQVFWTTDQHPHRDPKRQAGFAMPKNGQWLVTSTRFTTEGRLTDLRIDPGTKPGSIEIDWIRLIHEELHPLTVSKVTQNRDTTIFEITNHRPEEVTFTSDGTKYTLPGTQTLSISKPIPGRKPVEPISVTLQCDNWPDLTRTLWAVNPEADVRWLSRSTGNTTVSVAHDGSVALVRKNNRLVASLGPLATVDGELPALKFTQEQPDIRFRNTNVSLTIGLTGDEIQISIDGDRQCEGPVVRVFGELEQGLFAGLEYLGKNERSSSKLDITTEEHLRFSPEPLKVTMPLMAFVTDRASVALCWNDMALQPVYATPNFFDGTTDHRMTLRGKSIRCTIRIGDDPLEESIAWVVAKNGLPDLPVAPRSRTEQDAICLNALSGPLQTEKGWGHCVQERWPRRPYADMASTIWRLEGKVPPFEQFVIGGAHVPNGTIYFVTGQAKKWLDNQRQQMNNFIRRQKSDGSYRYEGKYARGHFEDTASGICALPAARLLEFAYITGDKKALEAGLKTLDYMKRFRTPRGAQTWECALHTPDLLASAYLVWAYSRGFELTGDHEYLEHARKWALSGLPFTYLWSRYPIMAYATPPVYGATNWVAPNWMGLPVQWVGGVYAYALTCLAPHETTVDWNQVARGILISAQQQQYPDGPHVGLLPDSFNLAYQRRQPADINPCALVSLQRVLDGEIDFLSVARGGNRVVAAPFPVTIRDGSAHIQGRRGVTYQVLVNGDTIINVTSQGNDVLDLD